MSETNPNPAQWQQPPENHTELAESFGIDMSFLEKGRIRRQEEIFGKERLEADEVKEPASPESVLRLINTVEALCGPSEPGVIPLINGQRRVRDLQPLKLPEGVAHIRLLWDKNVQDRHLYPVTGGGQPFLVFAEGTKRYEQTIDGQPRLVSEGVYVSRDLKPLVRRTISPINGDPDKSKSAEKPATEEEISAALDVITEAVRADDQFRAERERRQQAATSK